MNPITILHYGEQTIGHSYVKELIQEQKKYHDIKIISVWNNKKDFFYLREKNYICYEGVFENEWLLGMIKLNKINIIHFHIGVENDLTANFLKKCFFLGIKIFFNAHGGYGDYQNLVRFGVEKYVSGFIAQHESVKIKIEQNFQLNPTNVYHIPLTTIKRNHTKKYDKNKISFGYIGRMNNLNKGVGLLSKAGEKLEKEFDNYEINIFTFHLGEKEKYLMKNIGIFKRKNIHFFYDIEDKEYIFSKIDFLIIPSYVTETGPMVLYEALSAKTPCMVSNNGDMKHFVKHGLNGLIFKQKNVYALYESMKDILQGKYDGENFIKNIDYNYFMDELCIDLFKIYGIINYGTKR